MSKFRIYKSYRLKKLTTFKIGGKADFFCRPSNIDDLITALNFAKQEQIPVYIIGGGSNVLISDNGIKGLVICTVKLCRIKITHDRAEVQAGISINNLNKILMRSGLAGMEFTGGLPGSFGGAVYMNARVHGKELADVIKSVRAINEHGKILTFSHDDLDFSYKHSIFMERPDLIIIDAVLQLEKGNYKAIKKACKDNTVDRRKKKHYRYPSAGCIFKNNYSLNIVSGKLIDELGLKGKKIGRAEVFKHHANFIVNKGNAKAEDVKQLIEFVENEALSRKNVKLEREVRLLGF